MCSIKRVRFFSFPLLVFLILVLGACSTVKDPQQKKPVENAGVETEAGAEEILERIPNPYLEQTVTVPGAAKKSFSQALALMQKKAWEQAEAVLLGMGEQYPKLSGPYVNLGIVYNHLERYEEAERALKFAIELNALNTDAYNQLGVVLRKQGKFDEAEKVYLDAIAVWPHNPETHRNLGVLYDLYMGKFPEAIKHYEMCEKLLDEPDRKLKGWVIDLKRRMKAEQQ